MAQNQAYLFLVFSFTGVIIGLLFDIFRILRRTINTANIITYFEDILFWILTGLLFLYNIWYFNNGEIRTYMFLAIALGLLIYMSTLSNMLIKIFSNVLQIIIKTLKLPFKTIISIFRKIITLISTKSKKMSEKFLQKRRNFENNGE